MMMMMMTCRYGRRKLLFISSLIRLVGLLIATALSMSSYYACVVARFVLGFGHGGSRVLLYVLSMYVCIIVCNYFCRMLSVQLVHGYLQRFNPFYC